MLQHQLLQVTLARGHCRGRRGRRGKGGGGGSGGTGQGGGGTARRARRVSSVVSRPPVVRLTCVGAAGLLRHLAADVDFSCEPHHCNNGAHMMQAG